MRRQKTIAWIDPKFKKKLKSEALEKDMSLLDYTKLLGECEDVWLESKGKKDEKKNWNIRF